MSQVQQLVDMGFAEADAKRALAQVGNLEQAVERLLSGGGGEPDPPPAPVNLAGGNFGIAGGAGAGGGGAGRPDAPPTLLKPTPLLPAGALRNQEATGDLSTGVTQPPPPTVRDAEDLDLSTALEMSMREQQEGPALATEGARQQGLPCGLLNIGNTCYVNSLLQTLIHIDEFREQMLRYRIPAELQELPAQCEAGTNGVVDLSIAAADPELTEVANKEEGTRSVADAQRESRKEHGVQLASELRHLFAYSLFTKRSCIDPSRLLSKLVDRIGQKLPIGNQEDVGEFMLKLLEQLEEGLRSGKFIEVADAIKGEPVDAGGIRVAADGAAPIEDSGGTRGPPGIGPLDGDCREPEEEAAGTTDAAPVQGGSVTAQQPLNSAAWAAFSGAATGAREVEPAAPEAPDKEGKDSRLSLLQSLLFGEQEQIFSYREGGEAVTCETASQEEPRKRELGDELAPSKGGLVVNEERSEFLHIFLDVKHRSLYNAWEAARCTEVDYTTPQGTNTTASTSTWIRRLPKLLFFQLQRVAFNQETKAQVKLDDKFEFDATLHVDRFLLENRKLAMQVADHVEGLRQRREELAEALRRFEDFRGRPGLGVHDVLDWAADCLEGNAQEPEACALPSPSCAAAVAASAGQGASREAELLTELRRAAPSAASLLRGLRDVCGAQAQRLRSDISGLDEEIGQAYAGLREQAYELYAIWIHSGIAGSGHYLAYLRDWQQDRWYRLDDAVTSVVDWEDVRLAAVGQEGSNTSAYVLVYVEAELAAAQRKPRDSAAVLLAAEAAVPRELQVEIHRDNEALIEEQAQREIRIAEQDLRRHAEAIFQHYAGLIHQWEPLKRTADSMGNPHDLQGRKFLHDAALLQFDLFIYRLHGEQEVFTLLIQQSVEAQRMDRKWKEEDEGCILYFLSQRLRSQSCYASMLREKLPAGNSKQVQCELVPLDLTKLDMQYQTILTQAHVIDEALQLLKNDRGDLVKAIGMLAFIWAKWNLEQEDKFRQNEVLLLMSALIYNTVNLLWQKRSSLDASLATFQPACEFFLQLLYAVEWPKSWKTPLIGQLQGLFPQANVPSPGRGARSADVGNAGHSAELKEAILKHPLTMREARLEELKHSHPEPGQEFFERHRALYAWVMQGDEAIAQEFVISQVPSKTTSPTTTSPTRGQPVEQSRAPGGAGGSS